MTLSQNFERRSKKKKITERTIIIQATRLTFQLAHLMSPKNKTTKKQPIKFINNFISMYKYYYISKNY